MDGLFKKNNETTGGDYDPTINGQVYSTTVINGQTWTTENYNNANNDGITYKFGTDTPAHGLLYTIAAAEAITLPPGWRIPTEADFYKLLGGVGAVNQEAAGTQVKDLMSTTGWINGSGNDASGFNAFPVGFWGYGTSGTPSFQP